MHYLIYETTNTVNGKKYRGAHKTEDPQDGYLGSGKLISAAIKKYGNESFIRTILRECSSLEEMYIAEAEFVTVEWVKDPMTYNLKVGGEGGWDYIAQLLETDEEFKNNFRKAVSEAGKRAYANGKGIGWSHIKKHKIHGFKGKQHTEEAKRKISESNCMNFDPSVLEQRRQDLKVINPEQRGNIMKLSRKWGVSHTQVRRFIEKFGV